MAWFTLNEPPRITAPLCGSALPLQEPTHILFQWMDGGNVLPGSALGTEYELTLVEVFPEERNVEDAIRSSVPLLQTITTETSYLYGITDAALIPGQKYAFRVRAVDTDGRGIFKNEGYSEVCSFTYGDGLVVTPPDGIQVYPENARKALVNWHLSIDPDAYRVEYRRKADSDEEELTWFSQETTEEQVVLRDLEPETTYEVRVASLFSSYVSRYSTIQTFTTPEVIVAACGAAPAPPVTASTVPLITAMAGQYWQVGDFEMQVREVRGGDGVFSGWGVMSVPYLNVQIPVKFDQVWVDEDYNLVRGEVIALSEGLEGFQERWQEEHSEQEETRHESGPVADGETDSENGPGDEAEVSSVTVAGAVTEVYVNEQGQVIAVDSEGNEEVVAEQTPQEGEVLAVTDSQGNRFTVDSGGGISNGEGSNTPASDSDAQAASIKQRLIQEALEYFKEEVSFYLENKDKGPLDEAVINRMLNLPNCLSGDEESLNKVLAKIDYFIEHRDELIALIETDKTNRDRFDFLVGKLNGKSPPYREGLTEAEWDELIDIVCPYLLPDEVEDDDTVYNFFVTDDDAWYREKEAPYEAITPVPSTNILAKGLQLAVLEVVQDGKNKDVAKIKLKGSGEIEYTTLTNLSEVKALSKELKYKLVKDYAAVKLPYASESAGEAYHKDVEFTAYKRCGDYVKVKGEGSDIEGHWIEKSAAVVDCGTGFCCQKCGKDLTLTLTDLQTIYGTEATFEYVTHLNTALKKGGFNTCTSHAHFFSQSQAEVSSNFHLDEVPNYRLHKVLELHRYKRSLKPFYKQSFWDDETYLNYFQFYVFKETPDDYKGTKYKGGSEETFTWGPDDSKSIKVPTLFTIKKDENYQKVTYSKIEVKKRNKKLFSYLYANKYENGAPSTEDGWNFRGKGLIHLTWRENYRRASTASGDKLDYTVNWETNYDNVSNNPKDAVYSAVAYFLFKLNTKNKFKLLHDETKAWDVSKWVNGLNPSTKKPNGWPGRKDNFNTLTGDLFKCDE